MRLLDHGGYFWCTLCHALRNWRNPEWKPLSGTDGLRVGGKVQKALLHKCRVFYGDDFVLVAYSRLEKTTPGQIMIWQAENPMPPSTRSNWGPNCSFMSSKPGWSEIGNICLVLEFAIRGQRYLLTVTSVTLALVDNMRGKLADSFGGLEWLGASFLLPSSNQVFLSFVRRIIQDERYVASEYLIV